MVLRFAGCVLDLDPINKSTTSMSWFGGVEESQSSKAGKTALARVLLGLWPAQGENVRLSVPKSFSIVPQRPYLAPGCLGDQVTYPKRFGKEDEADAEMALEKVGLLYLLQRGSEQWRFQCDWEDQLSGGEQQRLALSRVLFHRPSFAVLDECTSMVAADVEERLYHTVVSAQITPITMSQRLFLPELHSKELRLGVASSSKWSLVGSQGQEGQTHSRR